VKRIIIAIDGYAGCGKSTLARQLARELGYVFLDTGAMYRAVTLFLLRHNVNWQDPEALRSALGQINLHMTADAEGRTQTWLNGELVEEAIRGMEVSNKVSEVAAVSAVRKFLVEQQQTIGSGKGIVMDGRDIGTVVFPQAELKLFVTASQEVRARRRQQELGAADYESVLAEILTRDARDSQRAVSPLIPAADAVIIDTSDLDRDQAVAAALRAVAARRPSR